MDSTSSKNLIPADPDDSEGPAQPAASRTVRRFRRGTALRALGAALVGGALGGRVLPEFAAAKRRRKKRRKKRTPRPPTVRTQTFTNRDEIRFRAVGPADLYPSTIKVHGLTGARVLDVNVVLHDLRHDRASDVAVMVVSPTGKGAVLMHNAGGDQPASGAVLILDDKAAVSMPHESEFRLTSGTYKPTNIGSAIRVFPDPAPQTVNNSALSTFNGANPNGEWRLYATDDSPLNAGLLVTGWSLVITYRLPGARRPKPPRPDRPTKRHRRKHREVQR